MSRRSNKLVMKVGGAYLVGMVAVALLMQQWPNGRSILAMLLFLCAVSVVLDMVERPDGRPGRG